MHTINGEEGEGEGGGEPPRPLLRGGVKDSGLSIAVVLPTATRPRPIRLRCFAPSKPSEGLCCRGVSWLSVAFSGEPLEFESTPGATTLAEQDVVRHRQMVVSVVNSPPPVLWGYDPAREALSNAPLWHKFSAPQRAFPDLRGASFNVLFTQPRRRRRGFRVRRRESTAAPNGTLPDARSPASPLSWSAPVARPLVPPSG